MASSIISRLKKTGQPVTVTDSQGKSTTGTVSGWDDVFLIVKDNVGDEVIFPLMSISSIVIPGGFERLHAIAND